MVCTRVYSPSTVRCMSRSRPVTMASSGLLAGKRCLVTGGNRGIGKAIAETFAREGASLALVARSKDKLEAVSMQYGVDCLVSQSAPSVSRPTDTCNRARCQLCMADARRCFLTLLARRWLKAANHKGLLTARSIRSTFSELAKLLL